jgi:tetratricopeptide (TPR) repeat protein
LLYHLGNYSRDPEERAAQYRAALIIRRDSTAATFELGLALMDLKDLDGAVATFRRTIALDPKLALAHCNLGHALSRQGKFREALPAYERGHELGAAQPGWTHPSARWLRDCQASIAAGKQK